MIFGTRAVKGILLFHGHILILEKHLDAQPNVWDLPGGLIESNETDLSALTREIKEELDITISEKMEYIGNWYFVRHYDYKKVSVSNYLIKITSFNGSIKLSDEHVSYKWIKPEEINHFKIKDPTLISNLSEYFRFPII